MIIFINPKTDNMRKFKKDIHEALVEMAADAIGPINGDYESFDKDVAQKLEKGQISLDEARQAFAENFYCFGDGLRVKRNAVYYDDSFNIDGTCNEEPYNLDRMAQALVNKYPDIEIYGLGLIDYHCSSCHYALVVINGKIGFEDDECADWTMWLDQLRESEDDVYEEMEYEEYSIDQLKEDIETFINENELSISVEDLLERLGVKL
ncbi:MAG: hypothetical protein K6F79_00645 [Saccharofermentans sp.]|nr:hypothetical protein [Saccharofermentans sp.]